MRIQTRLFLGTALLVLALMAAQWWLHQRQLEAMEAELAAVATSVGKDLLTVGPELLVRKLNKETDHMLWVDGEPCGDPGSDVQLQHDVRVVVIPEDAESEVTQRITRQIVRKGETNVDGEDIESINMRVEAEIKADRFEVHGPAEIDAFASIDGVETRHFALKVVAGDEGPERFLVITSDSAKPQRIPIPVEPSVRSYRSTMRHGALVGGVLLVFGLVGAGVLSSRVTRPLRQLAEGSEAVGRGEFGVQVPITAAGEVGELQSSFNAMSARLAELEHERDRWREREHLAQLGDLSRGLAHTVRNPLNTLGLAVEELASVGGGRDDLVTTARSQIRRIDQWLRSFLALGAEDAAEPTSEDLGDLTRAVVLEAVQQGTPVKFEGAADHVPVSVVVTAVRAALANLVENAAAVTPTDAPVEVGVRRDGDFAVATIRDHGPGLPDDVRQRLFEPHVTTKVGGSGMGLFLARQLVVGMHGGSIEIDDHPEGGTIAVVKLLLRRDEDSDGS